MNTRVPHQKIGCGVLALPCRLCESLDKGGGGPVLHQRTPPLVLLGDCSGHSLLSSFLAIGTQKTLNDIFPLRGIVMTLFGGAGKGGLF